MLQMNRFKQKLRISAKPILSLWLCFIGAAGTACFHRKGTVDVQEYIKLFHPVI